jgi:predicted transposase/invertase (TIGR01784 family)
MSALSLAFFIVLKHTQKIMSREIALQVMTTLSNTKIGGPMQEVLIGYLTRQTPEENKDVLLEVTSKMLYDTEGGKRAMTMAEALFKEGQEAGLKIGQEAGLKEGQKAGLRSVARSLLREGLDQELVQRVTGLPAEQIEALAPDTDEA